MANPWSRRRVLQCLAGLPLATAAACRTGRPGVPAATRITLAGQALMTHPLCDDPYPGLDEVVAELSGGAAVLTDLEAAILTPDSGKPTRDTVFLHVAPPSVLSCLQDMGFNLLARGNNHAWDLDTAGVLATRAAANPVFFQSIAAATGRLALSPGGVLIRDVDGAARGAVIGAVGISGDTGDCDEACALAGIRAAGLSHGDMQ